MKVLAIPDLHCHYDNYSRPGEDGTPSRLVDWRRTADALVKLAIRERVDLAVAPGDYFVTPRPPARAIIEVANLFARLEAAGIPVVGCSGNHDTPGPGHPGPVDVIATLGQRAWGITTPQVVEVAGIQVAVLPWAKPSAVAAESESTGDAIQQTAGVLLGIARALAAQCDLSRPTIMIGHWAVAGCRTSSGQVLFGEEPTLPLAELQTLPFQAVIMGHIHRPQEWTSPGAPPVIHTGALERRDFGEEHDRRGAYIVDLDTREVQWHDLPARRFLTIDLANVTGGIRSEPTEWELDQVRDAIVRVCYRATEEQAKGIDHADIIETLYDSGARHVAGVFPEIIRGERGREASVTETTSPLEALDKWLALRADLSEDLRTKARAEAEALLKEVSA
ncbi:MAG TPA: exonuclease SbcCD subunit D [Firmicutes bacterium]|nr:exonuclease SbcCD subunit D [Bacillota bacterium]